MPTRGCGSRPRRFAKPPPPSLSDGRSTPGVPRNVGPSTCSSCDASGSWFRSRHPPSPAWRAALLRSLSATPLIRTLNTAYSVVVSAVGRRARTWPCGSTQVSRPGADERTASPHGRAAPACGWALGPSGDAGLQEPPPVNESPSPVLTRRFLALCEQHGSQRLPVQVVAVGRSTGVEGLPASDDWTTWDTDEMRVAVDYLQRKTRLTR